MPHPLHIREKRDEEEKRGEGRVPVFFFQVALSVFFFAPAE